MNPTRTSVDPRHEAALEYIRRGLAVVPLQSPVQVGGAWRCSCGDYPCKHKVGKHPRPGYGLKHAITTADEVDQAWAKWPDANVGVVIPSGFFVADLDGSEAIAWWDQNGGGETPTRTALSGSGVGQHRWYRVGADRVVRNGVVARFGDKVHQEVKIITAGMGYVVAPPSVWAKEGWSERGGALYAWWDGGGVAVEAPEALLTALTVSTAPVSGPGQTGDLMAQAVGMVEGTGRDSLVLKYLGVIRRAGAGWKVLMTAAEEMNSAFAEALEQRQIEQHVDTILGKPGGQDLGKMVLAARMDGSGSSGGNGSNESGDINIPEGAPTRLQVERTDPKTWMLHFPDGVVRVSSTWLGIWGRIETAHLEQLERSPRWSPGRGAGNGWLGDSGLLARLELQMTDEDHIDAPPELTVNGQVETIIGQYVGIPPKNSTTWAVLADGGVWWDFEHGRVCFKFRNLYTSYTRRNPSETHLSKKEVAQGIKAMGGTPSVSATVEGGNQIRYGWIPINSLVVNQT